MNARRTSLLALPLIALVLLGQVPQPGQRPFAAAPTVMVEGRLVEVPVTLGPGGPMVALAPLAELLGGTLAPGEAGESYTLRVGETEVILGIGSAVVTVGDSIASLSQPPTRGEDGPLVPLDFLNRTFGDLAGYSFDWRPEQQRLTVGRRSAREINVALDVVYLQGMTTVVLQFDATPRYRLREQAGQVTVEMLGDRLAAPVAPPVVENPLVPQVQIAPQQVVLTLASGAEVESYVLENPFRLVFDVHQPAALTAPSTPAYTPIELPPGIRTIVIDPGHGGTETGAVGPSGVLEKELTLLLAQTLAARLQGRMPVRVLLTRYEDANLPHDTRTAIANQNKADLFVSIHLNSSLGAGANGAETYFLSSRATDPLAARSAAAENVAAPPSPTPSPTPGAVRSDGAEPRDPAAEDLQLILWDLAQAHHLSESQRFAGLIQAELNQALQLKNRGVKQAPFRVLMGAAMPAVLVELGFLSNPDEEKKLQDPAYRAELAEALVRAIARYKEQVEGVAPGVPGAPGGTTPGAPGAAVPPGTRPGSAPPAAGPGARPTPPPAPSPRPGAKPNSPPRGPGDGARLP
ncbi:MAG TPA: N-acetylmuramoyl-L-alanine amidase [Thermoanaerobaculia bacterium]|nr:N-acetylmuramoyl-L-alanine amidase [Thermoanaerobaculia bacterium]